MLTKIPWVLLDLPNEVLCEIAEGLSQRQLVALCCTSKLLYNISVDLLYRRIVLHRDRDIVMCCRTLSSNRWIAGKVRKLYVNISGPHKMSSFYRLVISSLSCVSKATNLTLLCDGVPSYHLRGLEHVSLDNLVFLTLSATVEEPVISFVYRNCSGLRGIDLNVVGRANRWPGGPVSGCPKLTRFQGPAELMPIFIPSSPVKSISVSFGQKSNANDLLGALSRAITPVDDVILEIPTWSVDYLGILRRHAPDLVSIQLLHQIWTDEEYDMTPDFLTRVASILVNFKRLRCLTLAFTGEYETLIADARDFCDGYQMVQSWKQICPSLETCQLPLYGMVWTVVTLGQSTCIVPDWTDENTRLQVYGLLQIHPPREIVQIREFPWFDTFVQGLCEMYGMGNPLDEDDYSDEDGQEDETDDEEEEYMWMGEDHESLLRKFLRNLRIRLDVYESHRCPRL